MALPSNSDFSGEIHYRRGAVMGLTVAEAFMLVAFILMMMLLFWRMAVDEETKDRIDPDIERLVRVIMHQNEDTRRKLVNLIRGSYLGEALEALEGLSKADLEALQGGAKPVDARHLKDLEAAEELTERLREVGIPIGKIEAFADMLREHNIEKIENAVEIIEKFSKTDLEALRDGATPVDPRRLKDLEAAEELVERLKETNVPIEKIEALADPLRKQSVEEIEEALEKAETDEGLRGRIQERLTEEDRARQILVDKIKRDLGTEVEAVGGRIDEFDGTITFPEDALFPVGRYDIRPRFVETLNRVCPIWLEKLWESTGQREIEEILIEGHSSSEWDSAPTKRDAWILNLELSQRRAQAVLVHCLHLVEGKPSGDWSREKLAAIGYSSSRPILEKDGQESRQKSRRAVFRMRLSREQLRREIQDEILKESPGIDVR